MHISICLLLTVENAIWVGVGSPRVACTNPPEDECAHRVFGEDREEEREREEDEWARRVYLVRRGGRSLVPDTLRLHRIYQFNSRCPHATKSHTHICLACVVGARKGWRIELGNSRELRKVSAERKVPKSLPSYCPCTCARA